MQRKIKLIYPEVKIPTKTYSLDAGYDCYLIEDLIVPAYSAIKFPLGFAIQINPNEMLTIRSRSSAKLKGVSCAESTCDAGYTGQLHGFLINHTSKDIFFSKGERVVQLVFVKIAESSTLVPGQLGDTERGSAAFGASGRF